MTQGPRGWIGGGGADATRVLIEDSEIGVGSVAERLLAAEGFSVARCQGPERHWTCPLVSGRPCALMEQADIVVHALNPDRPQHRAVLAAVRRSHPDVPVVLELPRSVRARHQALLRGCTVLDFPMTRSALVDAIRAAADLRCRKQQRGCDDDARPYLVADGDVVDCPQCGGSHEVVTLDGEPRMQVVACASGTWPVGVENRRIPIGR